MEKKSLESFIVKRVPNKLAQVADFDKVQTLDPVKKAKFEKNMKKISAKYGDLIATHAAVRYVTQRPIKVKKVVTEKQLVSLAKAREAKEKNKDSDKNKNKKIKTLDDNFEKKVEKIEDDNDEKYKRLIKTIKKKSEKYNIKLTEDHLDKLHQKIVKYKKEKIILDDF